MNIKKSAIEFYKDIQKDKSKYRLVNDIFITRYINDDVSVYVGEFLKAESVTNPRTINIVIIHDRENPQLFNVGKKICTTSLGFWKFMTIGFIEKPIEDILK